MRFALRNDELIPEDEALIPIQQREVLFSFGVYESLKVRQGVPLFLKEHIERLFNSAKILELDHPFHLEQMEAAVLRLIHRNETMEGTLRIQMFGGQNPFYLGFISPLPKYPEEYYREGVAVVSYQGERLLPKAKSNCLLLNYLARDEAARQGALEALLVNRRGEVTEGSRSNIFALKEGLVVTPEEDVLHGVTRSHILECCREKGIGLRFEALPLKEILAGTYQGLFISSTSMRAIPVKTLDDVPMVAAGQKKALFDLIHILNQDLEKREQLEISTFRQGDFQR